MPEVFIYSPVVHGRMARRNLPLTAEEAHAQSEAGAESRPTGSALPSRQSDAMPPRANPKHGTRSAGESEQSLLLDLSRGPSTCAASERTSKLNRRVCTALTRNRGSRSAFGGEGLCRVTRFGTLSASASARRAVSPRCFRSFGSTEPRRQLLPHWLRRLERALTTRCPCLVTQGQHLIPGRLIGWP